MEDVAPPARRQDRRRSPARVTRDVNSPSFIRAIRRGRFAPLVRASAPGIRRPPWLDRRRQDRSGTHSRVLEVAESLDFYLQPDQKPASTRSSTICVSSLFHALPPYLLDRDERSVAKTKMRTSKINTTVPFHGGAVSDKNLLDPFLIR